jgi:23S rRNA pseudouridine2605 synthase
LHSKPREDRATRVGRVSLARAMSKLSLASRKDAIALILAGRVSVDGIVVVDPARRVAPERARIAIDGDEKPVGTAPRKLIALNKPRGTITTRRDPEGRPTVFDLLGPEAEGLIAIGRLDRASSGLLLFTNDTQLAHSLTNPENHVIRRYVVTVRGRVEPDTARAIERGVGPEQLHATRVVVRKASNRETHLLVDLDEGRNREVRKLFAAFGHEVTRLHRIAFGDVELGDLKPGATRVL